MGNGKETEITLIPKGFHHTEHEVGGVDEIDVTDLTGVLANAQPAIAHYASHENGGGDEIDVAGLSGLLAADQHVLDAEVLAVAAALVHKARHQNGGADKISVAALSGLLADDQHVLDAEVLAVAAALAHKGRHENTGADEISVAALSGLLADDQHVLNAEVLAVAEAIGVAAGLIATHAGLPNVHHTPSIATKEFFVPAIHCSGTWTNRGHHGVAQADNADSAYIDFIVPADFNAITNAEIDFIGKNAQVDGNYDIFADYGAKGQQYNAHAESDVASVYSYGAGELDGFDISGILTALAAGDRVGISVKNNAAQEPLVRGIWFKYS